MKKLVPMVGVSSAIRGVLEDIAHAARSSAKVLITGESGVGKEIVARLVHDQSARSLRSLVTVNCAGFPDSLLESELFGHVKGSFTSAYRDKRGWLESANGGTIFLDEVGEMSLRMQALLLRFVESGEIQRVGSDGNLPALDVRVITATHRKLLHQIGIGAFREDLYYRLNVIHIAVPALRERREDVPVLIEHFLGMFSDIHRVAPPRLSANALQQMVSYEWPGNVRELRNVVERLVLRRADSVVGIDALPPEIGSASALAAGSVAVAQRHAVESGPRQLFDALVRGHASFWTLVHEPFMARDLTRAELREVIRLGLEHTRGNYKALVAAFNMPPDDYKRFLNFLRKHQCHFPIRSFRMLPASLPKATPRSASA